MVVRCRLKSRNAVVDCYYFDKELKALLFSAIHSISVAMRAKVFKFKFRKFYLVVKKFVSTPRRGNSP